MRAKQDHPTCELVKLDPYHRFPHEWNPLVDQTSWYLHDVTKIQWFMEALEKRTYMVRDVIDPTTLLRSVDVDSPVPAIPTEKVLPWMTPFRVDVVGEWWFLPPMIGNLKRHMDYLSTKPDNLERLALVRSTGIQEGRYDAQTKQVEYRDVHTMQPLQFATNVQDAELLIQWLQQHRGWMWVRLCSKNISLSSWPMDREFRVTHHDCVPRRPSLNPLPGGLVNSVWMMDLVCRHVRILYVCEQ